MSAPVLRGYQLRATEAIFNTWDAGVDRVAISAATGCHRAGQGVLMFDGSRRNVDNVRVGDQLLGPDATPRTVLQLCRGRAPMYVVAPTKGDPWVINGDHVLTLERTRRRADDLRAGELIDVTVNEWLTWPPFRKHLHKLVRAAGVDLPERAAPPMDPYMLGVLVGDGSLSVAGRVQVTNIDPEVIEEIHHFASTWGLRVRHEPERMAYHVVGFRGYANPLASSRRAAPSSAAAAGVRLNTHPVAAILAELGLSPIACADRFVPDAFKLGSREVRLQTLAGLIDTDGSRSRGGYEFGSKSERLANDVAFLARSLGLAAYVSKRSGGIADGHYRVSISGDCSIVPTRIARKRVPPRLQKKSVLRTGFTIEPTGTTESFYGFTLDGDQRYLLDDFTITHNSGKSVIFGDVARRHLAHHRDAGPVVLLAHRRELIVQAAGHFGRANPDLRVATVIGSPGPERSTRRAKALSSWRRADVLVSTVQTLASRSTMAAFPDPSLIIADEAHHFAAAMFHRVLTALGAFSGTRTLGVTATPFREDHREFSDIFDVVAASIDISWLINHQDDGRGGERECRPGQGYLVPPSLRHLIVDGLDLSDVPTSMRSGTVDFREAELAAAMTESGAFDMVAEAVMTELSDRKGVIFAPTVASSRYLADRLTERGAAAGHVDGMMSTPDRDRVINAFRDDKIRWLSNVGIVSEGFDIPEIDAVVLARPTKSRIFFRQAVGRALRPAPGKTDAIVLDVAGASGGHSLAGVEALTDHEVLTAGAGESLTDLLERTDRARRGRLDRITAHLDHARSVQDRAERAVEQMHLTAEGLADRLPGLVEFARRAEPLLHPLVDHTSFAVTRGLEAQPSWTLDELNVCESTQAEEVAAARQLFSRLESLKDGMREALAALREEPEGEIARAMVTGYVGTVRGELFGEEDEHYRPPAPGEVQGLKTRGGPRGKRPSHPARYGWAFRTGAGHLWIPVHSEAGHNLTGMTSRADVVAILVAVRIGDGWQPVIQVAKTGQVDELSGTLRSEDDAYRLIVTSAAERSGAVNLIDPNASWRRRESAPGAPARAVARRVSPGFEIPDDATAGYVGDVITVGQYQSNVDNLGSWVISQVTARIPT